MLCLNMAQTFPCYLMLAVFMVLVSYGAGDIQCEHSCQNKTCNYQQILDTCYYVFKDKLRNWFDSHWFCVDQGLSMVKVTKDMIEQKQTYDFRGLFNDIPKELKDLPGRPLVWLGGRVLDLSDWTFLNNTKSSPVHELPSNINFLAYCGFINMENNNLKMGVNDCSYGYPFICRFNKTLIQRIDLMMPWFNARSHCIKLGGDLFYLYQDETLYSIKNDIRLKNITGPHHIGLRHRVWKWIDGSEILFTNWETGEPNKVTEKCLLLYGDSGKWNDNYCYEEKLTFCQGAPSTTIAPTTAPQTPEHSTSSIQNNSTEKTISEIRSEDQLRVLVIILGSLLGVFFIISISLILYFLCTKCSCKSSNEDIDIIENNYYSNPSEPENGLVTTKNAGGTSSVDSTVEYSYGPPTAKATNGGSDFTSYKPVIKPKPVIGPKTGDVYSTVDKRSAITPDDTQLYVNSG